MARNPDIETVHEEAERAPESVRQQGSELEELSRHASELAHSLPFQPNLQSSEWIVKRRRALNRTLVPLLGALQSPIPKEPVSDDFRWLHDNVRLLYSELQATAAFLARRLSHRDSCWRPGTFLARPGSPPIWRRFST
jgi:hypothetical protein